MQRQAEFHHHIVGDVHNVVDRAYADGFQAFPHPFRTLADRDAANDSGGVFRAEVRRFNGDETGKIFGDICRRKVGGGKAELSALKRVNVARHAPVGQPVGTVLRQFK